MTSYPCDIDPDDPGPDLVDLLARSVALAKGERHLNSVVTDRERLVAERDAARNRINAVIRAVQDAQRNGENVVDNAIILAALGANQ